MSTRRSVQILRPPGRRALAITLAAGLLAACGSGGDDGSASPDDGAATADADENGDTEGPTTTLSQQEQVLAFYQCLRDQGVDVADPSLPAGGSGGAVAAGPGGPGGLEMDDPAVAAAVDRCGDEVGTVTFGEGQMGENMADTGALIEFVDCLRDHGIDMPDPGPDGRLSFPTNLDPQEPAFQSAAQECGPLLGGGGVLIGGGEGGGAAGGSDR